MGVSGSNSSEVRTISTLPGRAQVRALALKAGFTEAGVVSVPHANSERDAVRFAAFVEAGYAGEMDYLTRRNEAAELVRGRVRAAFPWARSVVVCLAGYNGDGPLSTEEAGAGEGWIARYAWTGKRNPQTGAPQPSDYHKVLLKRLKVLEASLQQQLGPFESRTFVDTGPLVERAVAEAAGLGWTGKNTCLIHPKLGSWNFLAVLITALKAPEEDAPLAVPDRCGSCTRCLDACPTGALIAPREMDARLCIAYLTIEHKGEIEEKLRAGMGRQVFGCDICQDVCPWNRKAPVSRDAEMATRQELVNPALEWLAAMDETGFEQLCNGSPMRRAGWDGFRRNVAIAMGNSGENRFAAQLRCWTMAEAPRVVRDSAQWALRQLGRRTDVQ